MGGSLPVLAGLFQPPCRQTRVVAVAGLFAVAFSATKTSRSSSGPSGKAKPSTSKCVPLCTARVPSPPRACVVMLAYLIIQALAKRWAALDVTVEEALDQLATLCLTEVHLPISRSRTKSPAHGTVSNNSSMSPPFASPTNSHAAASL